MACHALYFLSYALLLHTLQPPPWQNTSPDFAKAAETLKAIDEPWLQEILQSKDYCDFRNGAFPLSDNTALRYSMLTLADSLTPEPRWKFVEKSWLFDSNPYSAATFFNAFQSFYGNPSQGHAHIADILFRQRNRNIGEIEAAMFAHIKDEETFYMYTTSELIFPLGRRRVRGEHNVYAALAVKLRVRNKSYMNDEWRRLSKFKKNMAVRNSARPWLPMLRSDEAGAFSELAREVQNLHDRFAKSAVPFDAPSRGNTVAAPQETREFDVSKIRCGQEYFYSVPGLTDPYCDRKTSRRKLRKGRVRLTGTKTDLDSIAQLLNAVQQRRKEVVHFSDGRAAVVFPTDRIAEPFPVRDSYFLIGVIGRTAMVLPQNVFVVHTTANNAENALRLLDAIDNETEVTAQWSDNAFVAILKTPIPWVELGGRDFVFEHMPEDEDFRCLEWKGYSRLAILKASQKGIERIAQVLKDLPAAPGNKNHR